MPSPQAAPLCDMRRSSVPSQVARQPAMNGYLATSWKASRVPSAQPASSGSVVGPWTTLTASTTSSTKPAGGPMESSTLSTANAAPAGSSAASNLTSNVEELC